MRQMAGMPAPGRSRAWISAFQILLLNSPGARSGAQASLPAVFRLELTDRSKQARMPALPGSLLARHYARCYDSSVVDSESVHKLTDLEASAAANLFLSDKMPDHYCAGAPTYD